MWPAGRSRSRATWCGPRSSTRAPPRWSVYWVGRSLIERNAERYAREAELRFSLVRVNEHIDAIALAGGEADEARRIELDLAGVLLAMRKLVTGLTNLTWVTAGYGWFTLVAPILAAAPLYFAVISPSAAS
jgi:putative ATP-binding cassette transporter